ncbi:histone-lysine N-methyltransferase PRDM9 isoform 1-T3 [Polymixia lowei]
MSGRGNVVEWVETTEEVIVTEECVPPDSNPSEVIPVLESTETPIQKLLDTMVQGEDPECDDGFYCEECRSLFQDQSDVSGINGPSFILDSPTTMGVQQRALLTLPHGLMIGRSSIPNAGLGVMNYGPPVSPGMHFGPYEGEVTTRENAMANDFSWEIYKGKDEYEYIDATRESHSNWMRYVNCARNEDEKNLLAVQYKDSILFHCCRTIHPGDELMVWPSSKLLTLLSEAWTQIWFMKLSPTESNTTVASQIFLCSHCQLSFTTEAYLQRHAEYFHLEPKEDCTTPDVEAAEPQSPLPGADTEHPAVPVVVFTVDPFESKTCSECGKIFKHTHHLKRHKLCVHSNKRPYCCSQCRRTFTQASGLLRHQLVHKKQALVKECDEVPSQSKVLCEKMESSPPRSEATASGEPTEAEELNENEETNVSEKRTEAEDADAEEAETAQEESDEHSNTCVECDRSFTNECYLKKHKLTVHGNLRPYVCTLCRKCFGQYSDLARHLSCHQRKRRRRETQAAVETSTAAFCCGTCSLSFASEDSLQQHLSLHHAKETSEVEDHEKSPVPAAGSQGNDPDFIAQSIQRPPSQRPQRLGARSKISAITKLIAPKRRARISKKNTLSPAPTEKNCSEPEAADVDASAQTDGDEKSAEYTWYSCSRCKGMYGNPGDLKAHKCTPRQHKCVQCGATFKKLGFLKRHERTAHVDAKSYTCDNCGKSFGKPGNLKQHQKTNSCEKHHCTSELFSCSFCQFSFTMKSYLRKHVMRHHPVEYLSYPESYGQTDQLEEEEGGKSHDCPQCGKTYVSAKHFKAHTCFQQVRIVYLCTDCGKGFTNHYGLKQHQRVHTGEKPYSCPHCAKSFSYTGQLNVHIRTHTGEKPYLCTHCGESFRQSGDLKRHERKHTGVRPYNCPDCLKSFSRPQSLKAHQMLHLGQKMFKCTQCGKSFSRNYHLRRHHQKMHS